MTFKRKVIPRAGGRTGWIDRYVVGFHALYYAGVTVDAIPIFGKKKLPPSSPSPTTRVAF